MLNSITENIFSNHIFCVSGKWSGGVESLTID